MFRAQKSPAKMLSGARPVSRRSMLALVSLPLLAAGPRLPRGGNDDVLVKDHPTPQSAADAAAGKRLVFPEGRTYTVTSLSIPAGCHVVGNGSTLRFPDDSTKSTTHSDEILAVRGSGVTIENLRFDGRASKQGATWSQYRHCVRIQGNLSDVVVKNCEFGDIIGDGVYVNIGSTAKNCTIGPDNTFTSDHFNRNGVSIVTGTRIEVHHNRFVKCSRSGMPGPIDLEPNSSAETLSDVSIHHNTIVGGSESGTGTLPGIVYSGFQNAAAKNINIHDNDISGTRFTDGILIIGISGGPFNAVTNLNVYNNRIHDIGGAGRFGVGINHYIGANVYDNTFSGMQWAIYNYKGALGTSAGNTFIGVATDITNDDPHLA
ncbi:right-handed parallel beta-helix repeat-containing protein [Streptomyces sp. NBC_00289]|uniref:hypothetical protein n=1 Tax=Streptomyces sp. NBC_00289 TaxID=2975703 RepID=UPI003253EAC5